MYSFTQLITTFFLLMNQGHKLYVTAFKSHSWLAKLTRKTNPKVSNLFMRKEKHTDMHPYHSQIVHSSSTENKFVYKPEGENQKQYATHLKDGQVKLVLGIGPAGTGKTLLACQQAIHDLKDGVVDKIIITRPVIPVEEEEIGFLPGNINKKMAPWTQPIFDIFMDHYTKKEIDMMIQFNIIEIAPLAFMRGRTFQRAFIIADEMQNSTPKQMLMLTSRLGVSSKMVITGDFEQSDKDKYNNGLADFLARFRLFKQFRNKKKRIMEAVRDTLMLPKNASSIDNDAFCEVRVILFNPHDIQRSPFVKKIIEMYNMENDDEKGDNDVEKPKRTRKSVPSPVVNMNVSVTMPEPEPKQVYNQSKPIITQLSSSEPSKMDAAIIPANHVSKYFNSS